MVMSSRQRTHIGTGMDRVAVVGLVVGNKSELAREEVTGRESDVESEQVETKGCGMKAKVLLTASKRRR